MMQTAKLGQDDLAEIIGIARDYLRGAVSDDELRSWGSARDFSAALVQLADSCIVGVSCGRHGGAVHGREAEELRAGVEQVLKNTSDVRDDEAVFVLTRLRRSLVFLLDRVDARDSLSFLEVTAH